MRSWEYDPPTNALSAAFQAVFDALYSQTPYASYLWVWEEKSKGIAFSNGLLGSDHGGWKFNTNYDSGNNLLSPPLAAMLTTNELKTNAFFDFGAEDFLNDYAVEGSLGNVYAYQFNNTMLSDAIPAISYPAGANPVPNFQANGFNFDMQSSFENGWPSGRAPLQVGASAPGEWHHSDCREVAYTYTYKLFNEVVTIGNIK